MNKILVIVAMAFLSSCGANQAIPLEDRRPLKATETGNASGIQNLLTFKVNGEKVSTTVWSISRFVWKNNIARIFMNITSDMHNDKRTINVNLDGCKPGKYPLANDNSVDNKSYGSYYPDYVGGQVNSFSFTSGVFELTEVDTVTNRVNGNFYGKVKNLKGDSLEITDGKIINGFLKIDITNY